jgi:hypothetical protein
MVIHKFWVGSSLRRKGYLSNNWEPTGTRAAIPARADSAVEIKKDSSEADADIEMTSAMHSSKARKKQKFVGRSVEFGSGHSSIQ